MREYSPLIIMLINLMLAGIVLMFTKDIIWGLKWFDSLFSKRQVKVCEVYSIIGYNNAFQENVIRFFLNEKIEDVAFSDEEDMKVFSNRRLEKGDKIDVTYAKGKLFRRICILKISKHQD